MLPKIAYTSRMYNQQNTGRMFSRQEDTVPLTRSQILAAGIRMPSSEGVTARVTRPMFGQASEDATARVTKPFVGGASSGVSPATGVMHGGAGGASLSTRKMHGGKGGGASLTTGKMHGGAGGGEPPSTMRMHGGAGGGVSPATGLMHGGAGGKTPAKRKGDAFGKSVSQGPTELLTRKATDAFGRTAVGGDTATVARKGDVFGRTVALGETHAGPTAVSPNAVTRAHGSAKTRVAGGGSTPAKRKGGGAGKALAAAGIGAAGLLGLKRYLDSRDDNKKRASLEFFAF